jgi:hypothetical protein
MRMRVSLEVEVEVDVDVVESRNESRCGLGTAIPDTASWIYLVMEGLGHVY